MNKQQRYDELNAKCEDEQQHFSAEEVTEMVNLWYDITGEPRLEPMEGVEVHITAIPDGR